jgi:glycosyltransferase involved in cell wall biosynthesis
LYNNDFKIMIESLSIVLPCYNEEENIPHAVEDVFSWMEKEGINGEIICVNDGSTDNTANILNDLSKRFSTLRVVTLEKNRGYGIAVRSGLDAATSKIIGFMDSDRQFHAEDISLLLPYIDTYDFVTGRRRKRADSAMRNILGKVLGALTWITFGIWIRDVNCGMKVFKKDLWSKIRPEYSVEKFFNTEMFLNLRREKINWIQIPVKHYPRTAGTPTGASLHVIFGMFKELISLYRRK